jgi:hypothetical protein
MGCRRTNNGRNKFIAVRHDPGKKLVGALHGRAGAAVDAPERPVTPGSFPAAHGSAAVQLDRRSGPADRACCCARC